MSVIPDAKKVEMIGYLIDTYEAALDDENADSNLKDSGYLVEAISAVLVDAPDHPILRNFLNGGHRDEDH